MSTALTNFPQRGIIYEEDCMETMRRMPDKFIDLAIVDPPYAVGASDGSFGGQLSKPSLVSGKIGGKHYANHNKTPKQGYFTQLFRISQNQIIWGSNYYPQFLYHSGAIIWDKLTTGPLSDCEIAFQSFNKLVIKYTHAWTGFNKNGDKDQRIHPNQKPVKLYKWLLKNYATPGQLIYDSHLGSGSSIIACEEIGFDWIASELDHDYCEGAKKRLATYRMQEKMIFEEIELPEQENIFRRMG